MGLLVRLIRAGAIRVPVLHVAGWPGRSSKTLCCACQLFERDNRSTRLTPAGEALLEEARTLLPAADATRRRVRDVAAGQRTFTIGFMPGLIVTSAVRELSRRSALIHEYAAIAGALADHITPA
jgi:hypothetical protein